MSACESSRKEVDSFVFKGQAAFIQKEKNLKFTCDEARNILVDRLKELNKSYVAFPEEVVMIYEGGYLFVTGDFKSVIQLSGYHVTSEGAVEWIDLGRAISVNDYMSQLERSGWRTSPKIPGPSPDK
jgi:hypothetical protein